MNTNNYNIVVQTEAEKYDIIKMIRNVGAAVTGVSGYGTGYYIQLTADLKQVTILNKTLLERSKTA